MLRYAHKQLSKAAITQESLSGRLWRMVSIRGLNTVTTQPPSATGTWQANSETGLNNGRLFLFKCLPNSYSSAARRAKSVTTLELQVFIFCLKTRVWLHSSLFAAVKDDLSGQN